jgi:sterol desaturase/sphingolipid hydroxylase (fatty acid hydroxylase superfamily)
MPENIIPLLVPFFIAGIIAEAIVAKRRKHRVYHTSTMVSDLGAGIASQVVEVFLKVLVVLLYAWVYEHWRVLEFAEGSPWPWIIAFVGIDLGFYWWHRFSHVVNVMWGVHVVHHHSEDFNLSVALRQPAFELATAIWFYVPLALFGVPAVVWVTMYALNLFFQFWVHTELVDRLGPLEGILNTPSAHRVHHGINPKYLDKNYGGIFMLWDRIFGTYQREEEPVVFGVTKPLRNFNPVWANVEYFAQLAKQASGFPSWRDKLWVWWAHPGWQPAEMGPSAPVPEVSRDTYRKYGPELPRPLRRYIWLHFWVAFLGSGAVMSLAPTVSPGAMILPGIVVLATLAALAGLAEKKRWAYPLDVARQVATVALLAVHGLSALSFVPAVSLLAVVTFLFAALHSRFRPRAALAAAA